MLKRSLASRVAARAPRLGLSRLDRPRGATERAAAAGGSSTPHTYLHQHRDLAQKLEDAVNLCVEAAPADPLPFMVASSCVRVCVRACVRACVRSPP
jgi:hypothetical protein